LTTKTDLTDDEWVNKMVKVDATSLRALILQQIKTIKSDALKTWWYEALTHAQTSEENSPVSAYLDHTTKVGNTEERVLKKEDLKNSATQNPKIIRPQARKLVKPERHIL